MNNKIPLLTYEDFLKLKEEIKKLTKEEEEGIIDTYIIENE